MTSTRVTMAIIRCAFLRVHVEEEMFAQFAGDEDDIENMEDESVEQEGPLGEGLGEAEVKHKVEEEALVAETLLTWTQGALATMLLNHSPGTLWILENVNLENLFHWENLMPISHDIVNLKGHSTFSSCSEWNKFLKRFSWSTKECATEDQILNHYLVNISLLKNWHGDLRLALSRCSWPSPRAFARAGHANQDWFPCIAWWHRSVEC